MRRLSVTRSSLSLVRGDDLIRNASPTSLFFFFSVVDFFAGDFIFSNASRSVRLVPLSEGFDFSTTLSSNSIGEGESSRRLLGRLDGADDEGEDDEQDERDGKEEARVEPALTSRHVPRLLHHDGEEQHENRRRHGAGLELVVGREVGAALLARLERLERHEGTGFEVEVE